MSAPPGPEGPGNHEAAGGGEAPPEELERALAPSPFKQRLARASLLAGVLVLFLLWKRSAPNAQELVLRGFGTDLSSIEVALSEPEGAEPVAGYRLEFAGDAPHSIRHVISLPNGEYTMSVIGRHRETELEGGSGASGKTRAETETTFERRVRLEGGELIVSPE